MTTILSIPRSAESSENQVPTPAEGHEETTPAGEDSPIATAVAEEPEASTEGPAVTDSPSGESENGTVGSIFNPVDFDQPTGSGMQPPFSEEGAVSSTTPVEEPVEAHPTQDPSDLEDDEGKKNTSKNISNTSVLQYNCWLKSTVSFLGIALYFKVPVTSFTIC